MPPRAGSEEVSHIFLNRVIVVNGNAPNSEMCKAGAPSTDQTSPSQSGSGPKQSAEGEQLEGSPPILTLPCVQDTFSLPNGEIKKQKQKLKVL